MPNPRATTKHLELSGVSKHNKGQYANRNTATGIIIKPEDNLECPRGYSKETKDAWNAIVPSLIQMTDLGTQDLPSLKTLFDTYEDYVKKRKRYQQYEKEHKDDFDEKIVNVEHKLFIMMNKARDSFHQIACRFGCVPTERSRLLQKVENEPVEVDPLAVILER